MLGVSDLAQGSGAALADSSSWLGPVRAIMAGTGQSCLAVIAEVEGPSYRRVGALMAIDADGRRVGSLSAGCVDADILGHARNALRDGAPRHLRYGTGSPFKDLPLPCGGGLSVWVLPVTHASALSALLTRARARQPATLVVEGITGALRMDPHPAPALPPRSLAIPCPPPTRLCVLGRGEEAALTAALAAAAGYASVLYAPDPADRAVAAAAGCTVGDLPEPGAWDGAECDPWTGVVTAFHDHDWEPDILARALERPALFVGAQGSRTADARRRAALRARGVPESALARLRAPVGLVPHARDTRSFAISVLAELAAAAQDAAG